MNNRSSYRASRSDYLYGSAAPERRRSQAANIGVISGNRKNHGIVTLPTSIHSLARLVVIVALLLFAVSMVRVGLSAASVTTTIAADSLSTQIEDARSVGSDLEVQQSRLANSSHVRLEAASLGMAAPATTDSIALSKDVVALDASGNLSLSGSLAVIAEQG